jgi:hypothetical protein
LSNDTTKSTLANPAFFVCFLLSFVAAAAVPYCHLFFLSSLYTFLFCFLHSTLRCNEADTVQSVTKRKPNTQKQSNEGPLKGVQKKKKRTRKHWEEQIPKKKKN